ncbi:MAG: AMP-binding protein [Aromatoleum sp.]|nr:AMP-binding protein [Aromatoleum sp.]
MEKIWLAHYPKGVPHEVDVRAYTSLSEIFDLSCQQFRDLPAFSNLGATLSYADVDARATQFATYLQNVAAIAPGERIAIMMPNLLQYPVAIFGAFRAGLVVVNCNPLYTARELEHQLVDSGATAIVVLENFAHALQEVVARTAVKVVITTEVGDLFPLFKRLATNIVVKHVKRMVPAWRIAGAVSLRTALDSGRGQTLRPVPLTRDDIAFLQYTGGTTGVPKGAMLTHGNMVANLQQISAWIGQDFKRGTEIVVTPLPLYHVFALTANLLTFTELGARNVLITNPRDIPALVAELKGLRFTVITGVNTLFRAMLDDPGFREVDMTALKVAFGGGMPVQRAVAAKWLEVTGTPLIEGYGLTETSPVVAGNPVGSSAHPETVGMPLPSTEIDVRDAEGHELPTGEVGELCVRGPQVMKGYWKRPDETALVFTADGWLKTGDLGFMNADGYIKITDRIKDMIVVSGFKVYPNEIEEVVMTHPGVLEAAAISAPDERSGEAVKIVVVRKDPALTAGELIAFCRERLTGYKVPKIVEFRSEPLPKSAVGKVLRRLVRDPPAATSKLA